MNQEVTDDSPPTVPGHGPQRRRFLFVALSVLLVLSLGIGWFLSRSNAASTAQEASVTPLVTVVVPAVGTVDSTVSVTGLISARNDIPIGNEGDPARISEVLVEPGDHVRAGQVLARLNAVAAESQVHSAEASLEEMKANDLVAQAEWARAQQGSDLFSKEENDRRRNAAATAQAKVKAAQAQLADARNKLAHTTILAPSDGVILTRAAEIGQIAVPGTSVLFRLGRDGQIELRGQVAEPDVPRLQVGQSARVRLAGVDKTFDGKIWQIGAIIDPTTRQGTVRIALSSADENLRPGAFARGEIQVGSTTGAVLPQTAVLSDEQGAYVLLIGEGGKVARRDVTVAGARSDGLLVSRGLSGNERIVAVAGAFLRVGEAVTVATDPQAEPATGTAARTRPNTVSAQ
jgi:RND family efflux transporter MFP subunit